MDIVQQKTDIGYQFILQARYGWADI